MNFFFSKIPQVTICFFFIIIFAFFFAISSISLKKYGNLYGVLFCGLKILSKNFRKSWNIFLKKYRYLKSKIFHKFHCLLFVFFYLFSIFDIFFFSVSPIQTCQKMLDIFVVLYYTNLYLSKRYPNVDYRFYLRTLENSLVCAF